MSFFQPFNSRNFVRILSTLMISLVVIIVVSSSTPVAANEIDIFERIAEAKIRVWGDYPDAGQAWQKQSVRSEISENNETEDKPIINIIKTEKKPAQVVENTNDTPRINEVIVKESASAKAENTNQATAKTIKNGTTKDNNETEVPKPQATVEAGVVSKLEPGQSVVVSDDTSQPALTVSSGDQWIDEILSLTNAAREVEGLQPLKLNNILNQAAAIRVSELPSSPSPHLRPDGAAFYAVFPEVGLNVKIGGENYAIASKNSYTAEQIVNAWLNSPSHRKNIMKSSYKEIGIGHAVIGDREYYEQLFIG